jgi:hypothetical protein
MSYLADYLDALEAFLRRFVIFRSDAQVTAIALWIAHTHAFEASDATPYLAVTSAERRSGKTRLLESLALLVRNPIHVAHTSAAALFRTIPERPTLLFDEVDAVFRKSASPATEELRAVLNAGHRRGATVRRCVGEGRKQTVVAFDTYCPKVLAGIGNLPDTIEDGPTERNHTMTAMIWLLLAAAALLAAFLAVVAVQARHHDRSPPRVLLLVPSLRRRIYTGLKSYRPYEKGSKMTQPANTPFPHTAECKTPNAKPEWFDRGAGVFQRICSCHTEVRYPTPGKRPDPLDPKVMGRAVTRPISPSWCPGSSLSRWRTPIPSPPALSVTTAGTSGIRRRGDPCPTRSRPATEQRPASEARLDRGGGDGSHERDRPPADLTSPRGDRDRRGARVSLYTHTRALPGSTRGGLGEGRLCDHRP